MSFFRQLSRGFKNLGRQLPSNVQRFGRQFHSVVKTLPSAFKDTSKIYSDIEKKTQGIPIVPNMFGFASTGTRAIGDLLSGNFGRAYTGGQRAMSQGADTLAQMEGMKKGVKFA